MWQNKTRPNKTARVPYAYIASEEDPLVLIPDPEVVRWVEDALDHLDQGLYVVEAAHSKILYRFLLQKPLTYLVML